jgi:glucose dehydrogenase
LTPAAPVLWRGGGQGYFYALDARTGKELWKANLGGAIVMAPITYRINGRQYLSVISGHTLVTFALRD